MPHPHPQCRVECPLLPPFEFSTQPALRQVSKTYKRQASSEIKENFWLSFTEVCFQGSYWQEVIIRFGNGLALMHKCGTRGKWVNTLEPWQNGCQSADDVFTYIMLNQNHDILIKIAFQLVSKDPIQIKATDVLVLRRMYACPGLDILLRPWLFMSPCHQQKVTGKNNFKEQLGPCLPWMISSLPLWKPCPAD